MKIGEAIEGLRSFLRQMTAYPQILRQYEAQLEAQQVWIDELEAELKEERYRHDRLQDFEVAEPVNMTADGKAQCIRAPAWKEKDMKIDELISKLRDISMGADMSIRHLIRKACYRLEAQQTRIDLLEAELKEERYRHDRVQDFEVAEAQELARVKGQLDEAIRELQYLSVCSTCSKNGTVCHVGMPVAEQAVCCGGYRWRGAKLEPPEEV